MRNKNDDFDATEICPHCGSDDITDVINYLLPDDEADAAPDMFECLDCGNKWESDNQ